METTPSHVDVDVDVVFVHGTGVRAPSLKETEALFNRRLQGLGPLRSRVHVPPWAEVTGAKPRSHPAPSVASTGFPRSPVPPGAEVEKWWRLVLLDPLIEHRLAAIKEATVRFPGVARLDHIRQAIGKEGFEEAAEKSGLGVTAAEFAAQASRLLGENDVVESASRCVDSYEFAMAFSRSLVAEVVRQYHLDEIFLSTEALENSSGQFANVLCLGRGGGLAELAKSLVTARFRSQRERFMRNMEGEVGDILVYQGRGEKCRAYLRSVLEGLKAGRTVVVAHSLGGILSVDMMFLQQLPNVVSLITIGSQGAYLYELNALVSLEYQPDSTPQKDARCRWINLFDPNDFLSFPAAAMFGTHVRDVEVNSGRSFPESHSAYFQLDEVWEIIREEVRRAGSSAEA